MVRRSSKYGTGWVERSVRLKQTRTPTGADRKWVTTVTDVMILQYAGSLDVAHVGPNPIHRACGLSKC